MYKLLKNENLKLIQTNEVTGTSPTRCFEIIWISDLFVLRRQLSDMFYNPRQHISSVRSVLECHFCQLLPTKWHLEGTRADLQDPSQMRADTHKVGQVMGRRNTFKISRPLGPPRIVRPAKIDYSFESEIWNGPFRGRGQFRRANLAFVHLIKPLGLSRKKRTRWCIPKLI